MTSKLNWEDTLAAVWRPNRAFLKAIDHIDPIVADDLVGIDQQKQALIDNTERFITGKTSNNALLWGSRGTGKSSLIKAVFNRFKDRKLNTYTTLSTCCANNPSFSLSIATISPLQLTTIHTVTSSQCSKVR